MRLRTRSAGGVEVEGIAALDALGAKKRAVIEDLADALLETKDTARLTLPAYALPRQRAVLLDGCPRPAGVALANVPFDLTPFRVRGPLDADCLPDLRAPRGGGGVNSQTPTS